MRELNLCEEGVLFAPDARTLPGTERLLYAIFDACSASGVPVHNDVGAIASPVSKGGPWAATAIFFRIDKCGQMYAAGEHLALFAQTARQLGYPAATCGLGPIGAMPAIPYLEDLPAGTVVLEGVHVACV
jgi:hypothetical protein